MYRINQALVPCSRRRGTTSSVSCALSLRSFALLLTAASLGGAVAHGQVTINGDPFIRVAYHVGQPLFLLDELPTGEVLIGNNSNNMAGDPVQLFDPAQYAGSPIPTADFGPPVDDADGLTVGGGYVWVADFPEGVRRIPYSGGSGMVYLPGAAVNGTGSPLAYRSDGHVFVGKGLGGGSTLNEYNAVGSLSEVHTTSDAVETMVCDETSGLIFYAPYATKVYSYDPVQHVNKLLGSAAGTIDGGLTFDPVTGLLLVGTVAGDVQTINPITGAVSTFATGFTSVHGFLRSAVSGDLYVLNANDLYWLPSQQSGPWTFCTGKVNSLGCTPSISMSAIPDAHSGAGCLIQTTQLIGNKSAIFIHSVNGGASTPFHDGVLCVRTPLKRHPGQNTGGTPGTCSGVLIEDLNTYIASGADPALVPGVSIVVQTWSRDPSASFGDSLSNAVYAPIAP